MSTVNDHESFGKWCLDSGASSHMVGDRKKMVSTVKPTNSVSMNLATNTTTTIQGIGDVRISAPDDKNGRAILFNKTLYVPGLRSNLTSVGKMTNAGHKVIFEKNRAYAVNKDGEIIIVAEREGELYYVNELNPELANVAETEVNSVLMQWHEKLGHLN